MDAGFQVRRDSEHIYLGFKSSIKLKELMSKAPVLGFYTYFSDLSFPIRMLVTLEFERFLCKNRIITTRSFATSFELDILMT
jgi:hypothetical protein